MDGNANPGSGVTGNGATVATSVEEGEVKICFGFFTMDMFTGSAPE